MGPEGSINDAEASKVAVPVKHLYNGTNPALIWIDGIWVKFREGFSLKLFLMLMGLIVIGTANRVAFKIMTDSTALRVNSEGKSESKYSTFLAQVTNFIYIPVFWPIVWYFMAFTKRYVSSSPSPTTTTPLPRLPTLHTSPYDTRTQESSAIIPTKPLVRPQTPQLT